MRAGDLNRQIRVKRRVQTGTNAANEPVFEWPILRRIAANVRFLNAGERFDSDQKFAAMTLVFKIRWIPLYPTDVIEFEGKNYDIQGIAEIGRRVGLEITAEWRQGDLD